MSEPKHHKACACDKCIAYRIGYREGQKDEKARIVELLSDWNGEYWDAEEEAYVDIHNLLTDGENGKD